MTPAVLQEKNIAFLKANLSASNVGDNDSEDINNRDTSPKVELNQLANANQQRQEDAAALQIEEQQQVVVDTNAVSDNNGIKMCCTSEVVPLDASTVSPCHISHFNEPASPKVTVKRRGLFFCCSKRKTGVNKRRSANQETSSSYRYEQELQEVKPKMHFFLDSKSSKSFSLLVGA